MTFLRQEYWSGLPIAPPGDLPNPGIEPRSPSLQADSLPAELLSEPSANILFLLVLSFSSMLKAASCSGWWMLKDGVAVAIS